MSFIGSTASFIVNSTKQVLHSISWQVYVIIGVTLALQYMETNDLAKLHKPRRDQEARIDYIPLRDPGEDLM